MKKILDGSPVRVCLQDPHDSASFDVPLRSGDQFPFSLKGAHERVFTRRRCLPPGFQPGRLSFCSLHQKVLQFLDILSVWDALLSTNVRSLRIFTTPSESDDENIRSFGNGQYVLRLVIDEGDLTETDARLSGKLLDAGELSLFTAAVNVTSEEPACWPEHAFEHLAREAADER